MIQKTIATRYSKALFNIGKEEDSYVKFGEEISTFLNVMDKEKKVKSILLSPLFNKNFRKGVIDDLCEHLKLSEVVHRFLHLLLNENRMDYFPSIVQSYKELMYEKEGKVFVVLTSAENLSNDMLKSIGGSLKRILKKDVILETKVDPKLIGGLKVSIGSIVYDDTVKTQLEHLRKNLTV